MNRAKTVRGAFCPPERQWGLLAAGAITGAEADRLVAHASECARCAEVLREDLNLLDPLAAGEIQVEDEPVDDGELDRIGSWITARPRKIPWVLIAAAAALVLVMIPVLLRKRSVTPKETMVTLARVYAEGRSLEMRIDGAAYSPLRASRAPGQVSSADLLSAEADIQRAIGRNAKQHDAWLQAKGRAELLRWRFVEAINSFDLAARAGTDSADFWIDYASAHFERAEMGRDEEQKKQNYLRSLDLLNRAASKQPANAAALFNRAIVLSRLKRADDAIRDLQACLKVEPDPGWQSEIRRRIRETVAP